VLATAVLLAGLTAALAPGTSLALAIALALLGAGWNTGLLSGPKALAGALDPVIRARTQGRVDVAVPLGGAAGGFDSGLMVATSSYAVLALTGELLGVATLTSAAIIERRRATASAATT
jgi:hypothetical protein